MLRCTFRFTKCVSIDSTINWSKNTGKHVLGENRHDSGRHIYGPLIYLHIHCKKDPFDTSEDG